MLERAAHLTEGWANSPWDAASGQPRYRRTCAAAPDTWRPWIGGARRTGARPCVSARGAPRITIPKELTEECLRGGSAPPNGSPLSCGGRLEHYGTYASFESSAVSFKRMLGSSRHY